MANIALKAQENRLSQTQAFQEAQDAARNSLMLQGDFAEQPLEIQDLLIRNRLSDDPYWANFYDAQDAQSGQGIANVTVKQA